MKIHKTIFFFLCLAGCQPNAGKQGLPPDVRERTGEINKAFISFRIGVTQWYREERFAGLLDLLDRNQGATDEITLFTSFTHSPLPPDVIGQRTKIMKERMQEARKRGYRSGINVLTTIGHHEENLGNSVKGDYTPMTNIDGKVCLGSFCPNDSNYQEYIKSIYRMVAEAYPDYIWIDDDVRFGHMPIGNGCFCDKCLEIFARETGFRYTRESLKKAFDEGLPGDKLNIRKAWLQHNRNTISNLFRLIEKTVHDLNPAMPLGFMTGERFFEGYDFDTWAGILAGPDQTPVMWRPGGGYYTDLHTQELSGKSNEIGRQVSLLPENVVSIQSEIENFPYQRLKKAANITVLEACSHIGAGCTGTAFNVLSGYDEPLDEFEPLVARIKDMRPFFDLLARNLGRSPCTGIQTFWNKESYSTVNLEKGNWTESGSPVVSHEFGDIGLPTCYSGKNAVVTLLGKNNVYALQKEEIRKLLSGGVYLDAGALQQLNDMGFGDMTGFEVTGQESRDRIEKFTNHPLNGSFAGRERDNRQSFWKSPAYSFRKTDKNAEILSALTDYSGAEVSSCTSGIFINKLGGRICVAGYYPWTFMENLSKSSQMKSVFRWLSNDQLPAYVASFHKINLWVREPRNGRTALAFTNSSFDPGKEVVLMIRTEKESIRIYDMECRESMVRSSGKDGPYQKFVLPEVNPWQMRLVVCD